MTCPGCEMICMPNVARCPGCGTRLLVEEREGLLTELLVFLFVLLFGAALALLRGDR